MRRRARRNVATREGSVNERALPSLEELALLYAHLADRVASDPDATIDPTVAASVDQAVGALRRYIPGLDPAPDAQAARILAASATAALAQGRPGDALARALRGLSFAPLHPELHRLTGSACLEMGAARAGVASLMQALWIHPGYEAARDELNALDFFSAGEEERGEPESPDLFDGPSPEPRLWIDDDVDSGGEDRRAA
jgi:hypothetical protein